MDQGGKGRLDTLDTIRGITLVSMICYHGAWDVVYLLGHDWPWYRSAGAFRWQQSICWTFILLSGFCIPLSRRYFRRGMTVFAAGALVTAVTVLFLPEDRVVFGVLTFLGSAMLIMAMLEKRFFRKITPVTGLIVSALLFVVLREVNAGYAGILTRRIVRLPEQLYRNLATTYLGFMEPGFFSTDYFSLIPWLFLFLCGYYLCRILLAHGLRESRLAKIAVPPFAWLGRHSLLIYLLHQPALYAVFMLLQAIGRHG